MSIEKNKEAGEALLVDLQRMRHDFHASFGRDPEAFLLGPGEFMLLKHVMSNRMGVAVNGWVSSYLGIPVRPKAYPGRDIEIRSEDVSRFGRDTP